MYQPSLFARLSALCIIFGVILGAFWFHRSLIMSIKVELAGIKLAIEHQTLAGVVPMPPANRQPMP